MKFETKIECEVAAWMGTHNACQEASGATMPWIRLPSGELARFAAGFDDHQTATIRLRARKVRTTRWVRCKACGVVRQWKYWTRTRRRR